MARWFSLLLLPLLLAACGDARLPQMELDGSALGTTFNVTIVTPPETVDATTLETDIVAVLQQIDALASTWREDSELSRLNADPSTAPIAVSPRLCAALDNALGVASLTGGAFDVTVGPLVNLWGFGPDGPVVEPPPDAAVARAMLHVGFDKVETDCAAGTVRKQDADVYIDLSGWAKGFAVDTLAELLNSHGIDNYLVEIGGELRVRGHNGERLDWAVAIEAPSTSERVPQAIIRITDTSIATSGDYRNYFEHSGRLFSHTIDPRTGRPVEHRLAAVTVVHPSAAFADALATALLVLGPENGPQLAEQLGIAAYFLVRRASDIEEITTSDFDALSNS